MIIYAGSLCSGTDVQSVRGIFGGGIGLLITALDLTEVYSCVLWLHFVCFGFVFLG